MPALLLGVGGYAVNSTVAQHELDRLLTRVASAQAAVGYSDRRISATVAYASPLLFSVRVQPQVRVGLERLVQDEEAGQVGAVRAERNRAARTSVWRWHRGERRARAALVRYLDARIAYLQSVAASLQVLYVEHPDLDRLLDKARRAFAAAGGSAERTRVDSAFAGGVNPG